jgi:hypothetical protein
MTIRKHIPSYRSGLEETLAGQLESAGIDAEYEAHKIAYVSPAKSHKYTPDFRLPNGIFVETKGIFDSTDRAKHLLVKAQHPELDIRFVFTRSKAPISKGSKTTYADWCTKNGFLFADKVMPLSWAMESPRGLDAKS